jgi:hypothetical protein
VLYMTIPSYCLRDYTDEIFKLFNIEKLLNISIKACWSVRTPTHCLEHYRLVNFVILSNI